MVNIILAFMTGLTTGGLSCLAVQGGLLASSMASQIENEVQLSGKLPGRKKLRNGQSPPDPRTTRFAWPIAAFLAAKLIAYTILGFLLGAAGSMFQLSPMARAVFQIAIGLFMIGSGLRMFNVHPIFRYFAIEPPAFIRRRLRKNAAGRNSLASSAILGLMTVLIPCGVTQAMMAAALATGNSLEGAALLFAFTLGTSPVFFAVAYFATQLGAKLEKNFLRFAGAVVLLLGLVAVDTGVNLAGSPVSVTRMLNQWVSSGEGAAGAGEPSAGDSASGDLAGDNVVTVVVENTGYKPSLVRAKAGEPVKLRLVTKNVFSCSRAFVIPTLNIQMNLLPTGEAWVDIPAQKQGTLLPFSCSMGMYTGSIVFE